MFSKQYQFGDKVFRLEAPVPIAEVLHSEQFRADELPADLTISATFSETMPENAILRTERAADRADAPYAAVQESPDGICLTLLPTFRERLNCYRMLQYAGFQQLLLRNAMCILHAACIQVDGQAILFSAPSQTGKSTQADLWAAHRGARIVNGDRTILRADGTAHGVYFSGESPFCENFHLPIRAVVMLSQAPKASIQRIRGAQAFCALYSQCSFDLHNAEEVSRITDLLMAFIPQVPIYRLHATPDYLAVEALEIALKEDY